MQKPGSELVGHSGNDEIGTPQWLFDWLDKRFWFNFDAASSVENAKTENYTTIYGLYLDGEMADDSVSGLTAPWSARRVFVNPPYSTELMRQFVEKAILERNSAHCIVMLLKYDASTKTGKLIRENFHLEYLPRVKYEGMNQAATFPSVIAIAIPDAPREKK